MDMNSDSAKAYIVDPLVGPDPSDETGLNSHFRSTFDQPKAQSPPARQSTGSSQFSSNNPFRNSVTGSPRKDRANVAVRPSSSAGYPTPPTSASPSRSTFPQSHRQEAFGGYDADKNGTKTRSRRSSSLNERYPGDMSHKPLDIIRRDSKKAHRSPHLRKHHQPGADTIDRLDNITGMYHHEGPYDAALLARNTSFENSPVAAVQSTTEEALKATPRENIQDSLDRHRPLEGVAAIPPGHEDRFGRRYLYREGSNMMIAHNPEGGAYKRWPDLDYHPDDIKGKGEPAYSLSKALKEHKARGGDDDDGMEMQDRRSMDQRGSVQHETGREYMADLNDGPKRSTSLREGMKKRIGSLRRRKD